MLFSKEFWEWARAEGYPSRGPRGSFVNRVRVHVLQFYVKEWARLHREKEGSDDKTRP